MSYNYQNNFTSQLTTLLDVGDTQTILSNEVSIEPPFQLIYDPDNDNGHYEVVNITGTDGTSMYHAALTKEHEAGEIVRMAITASVLNEISTGLSTRSASLVGVIRPYAGATAPTGYLLCDGSAVSRTTYSALFAILGEAFGAGDGVNTFNLPNGKGRTFVGIYTDSGFTTRGLTGGAKSINLSHQHTSTSHTHTAAGTTGVNDNTSAQNGTDSTTIAQNPHTHTLTINLGAPTVNTGDVQLSPGVNILMPYAILNWIIKI